MSRAKHLLKMADPLLLKMDDPLSLKMAATLLLKMADQAPRNSAYFRNPPVQRPSLVLQLFKRAVDGSLDSRGPEVDISPFTPIQVGNRNVSPQKMSGYQSKAHNYLHAMS